MSYMIISLRVSGNYRIGGCLVYGYLFIFGDEDEDGVWCFERLRGYCVNEVNNFNSITTVI